MPKPKPLTPAQRHALQSVAERKIYCLGDAEWPTYWCDDRWAYRAPLPRTMSILHERGLIKVNPYRRHATRDAVITEAGHALLTADA